MNLADAFKQNLINLEQDKHVKHIETMISNVFIYPEIVYKIYKNESFFFGDFSEPEYRKNFFKTDFLFNNKMAPDIYTKLHGFKLTDNHWQACDLDEAEDYCIVMKRIDDSKTLTNFLLAQNKAPENLEEIIKVLITRVQQLTEDMKKADQTPFNKKFSVAFIEDLEDLRAWAYVASPAIPKNKSDQVVDKLIALARQDEYFANFDPTNYRAGIDCQSNNILIDNGINFIDIMPPKEAWRVTDAFFAISRFKVDIEVLGKEEDAQNIYQFYSQYGLPVPEKNIQLLYEIRSALLMAAYYVVLGKTQLSQKYLDFIDTNLEKI